jgi:hypothetical protein
VSDTAWFLKYGADGPRRRTTHGAAVRVLAETVGGGNASIVNESAGAWDGSCWFSNDCYQSEYRPLRGVSRGFSFCDAGPLWDQAVTQEDVWEGVNANALEEGEWRTSGRGGRRCGGMRTWRRGR